MLDSNHIKQLVIECGASLCGISRTIRLEQDATFLLDWIKNGYSSSLDYLHKNTNLRTNIEEMVPGAQSVIVCAFAYKNSCSSGYKSSCKKKIASYAICEDYHTTIRKALNKVLKQLENKYEVKGRVFTDSAPIFEKAYAVNAGLGWIGKQSLLVTPEFGTFVLLGEIVIDQKCDQYDIPFSENRCGTCRKCVEACPNHAIMERHIDTRLCISRATIEKQDTNSIALHGWVFGCDECQNACPYSKHGPQNSSGILKPIFNPELIDWDKMTDEEFITSLSKTPLKRSGLKRIITNYFKNHIV
ncbi:MAG: tRNA epoxyqueuosine(34) reductase QueG [Alistipes sp.]|nr:tRNA epoxyqueuosine(34) reductase QueG [Candidatus Alistipes equi]